MVDYRKLRNFDLLWKELWKYTKIIEVLSRFIALELLSTMEKLWYYGKNYGTMEKTMVLYRKLWNFDLLWKILWYYEKNYDTIVNYS